MNLLLKRLFKTSRLYVGALLQPTVGKMAWITTAARTGGTCASTTWVNQITKVIWESGCTKLVIVKRKTIRQIKE